MNDRTRKRIGGKGVGSERKKKQAKPMKNAVPGPNTKTSQRKEEYWRCVENEA